MGWYKTGKRGRGEMLSKICENATSENLVPAWQRVYTPRELTYFLEAEE